MDLLNNKISTLLHFTKDTIANCYFEVSSAIENTFFSYKTYFSTLILWINNFLHNFFRYRHVGCSSIINEIDYFDEFGRELRVNDLADVDMPTIGYGYPCYLRYLGGGVWSNIRTTNNQFYYDKTLTIYFANTSDRVGPMAWGGKVELPKDNYGRYEENSTIEVIVPYLHYGQTPLECKLEEIENKKYFCLSITPMFDESALTVTIRFWKKNPELEKIKTIRQNDENITWIKSQVGGEDLGEYLITPLEFEEHKMIEIDTGNIIPIGSGDEHYDTYKVSKPIPLLPTSNFTFLNSELEHGSLGYSVIFRRIGFYDANNNPVGTIECETRSPLLATHGYYNKRVKPTSSTSSSEKERYKNILSQHPTTFRVFINDYMFSQSQYGITSMSIVIQDFLSTTTYDKFNSYYSMNNFGNYNIPCNSYITSSLGREIQGSIQGNQIRNDKKLFKGYTLNVYTGALEQGSSVEITSDFIPVLEIEINNFNFIISTMALENYNIKQVEESTPAPGWRSTEAWCICAYDENKNYIGYFRSEYGGNIHAIKYSPSMLRKSSGSSSLPTFIGSGDIKYIRYTRTGGKHTQLVFGPHT